MHRARWGLLLAVALISCVPEVTVAPVEPGTVTVSVASSSVREGGTIQATANATDSRGRALTSEPRTWTSSAPAVATVNASGLITGVTAGTANISASVLGRSGTVAVTVTPSVASVAVVPDSADRKYSDTLRFAAVARSAGGDSLTDRTFTWAITTGATFASVNSSGLVTPVLQGDTVSRRVVVSATAEDRSGSAVLMLRRLTVDTVIVSPASSARVIGDTLRFSAQPRHRSGTVLTQRTVTWSSSNTAVATVSSSGLVRAVSSGTATITATSEGKSTTAAFSVSNLPLQSITVVLPQTTTTLAGLSLATGRSQQLAVRMVDNAGNVVDNRTVTWSSASPSIVSVSATGVVTANVVSGTVSVTATAEGRTATVPVTIAPAVGSVTTLTTLSLTNVQTATYEATVRTATSAVLSNRVVTFRSLDSTMVRVDPVALSNTSGVSSVSVRGLRNGTTSIIAESEGRADTTTVTVADPTVASVTFDGALATAIGYTIGLNRSFDASVTPRDALNNAIPGRTITWTSSAPTIISVDTAGVIRSLATGSASITAAVGAISASRTFNTQNPVDSLVVSSTSTTLAPGANTTVSVTARDGQPATLSNRPFLATSADTTVARVEILSPTSIRLTAVNFGTTTVTLTSETKSTRITVRVADAAVASVTVTGTSTITRGATTQLTATLRDAANVVLTGRAVTWTSSNTAVATVSSTGLVTGVGGGNATITATSEGVSGTTSVTVTTDVSTVTVTPATFTLNTVGATQTLTATPRNAGGTALTGRTVTWTSLNTAVATVGATNGVVTAVGSGTTTIRATVEGVVGSATVTVSVASTCTAPAYTVGTSFSGQVTSSDCFYDTGIFEDRFTISSSATRYITFNVTPSGGTAELVNYTTQNSAGNTTPFFLRAFTAAGSVPRLYGGGTHIFAIGNGTTAPVSYSGSTTLGSLPATCQNVVTIIGSGVATSSSLTTASCLRSGKYEARFRLRLNAGQQITVGMASATFDTYLELWGTANDTITTRLAFDDDGGEGTNSVMTFTATSAGEYELKATTFSTSTTGAYSISISTSPASLMAPALTDPGSTPGTARPANDGSLGPPRRPRGQE